MKVGEPNGKGQILVCKTSVLSPLYHPRPDHLPNLGHGVQQMQGQVRGK